MYQTSTTVEVYIGIEMIIDCWKQIGKVITIQRLLLLLLLLTNFQQMIIILIVTMMMIKIVMIQDIVVEDEVAGIAVI